MAIQGIFENALKTPAVATAFAYESMTGKEKFGGKGGTKSGRANYILVWDYNLTNLKYLKITPDYAARIGKKMKVAPDLKSGHYSRTINGKEYKIDTRCHIFSGHFDLFKELLVNSEKKAQISVNIRNPYDRNSLYHYSRIVPGNFQSYQRGHGYGSYLLNKTEEELIKSKNAKFNKLYACGDGDSGEFYLKRGYKRHNQDVYKDLN